MSPIRIAVVGVGHLGKIHARLLCTRTEAQLVAVADTCEANLEFAMRTHGVEGMRDYRELVGRVDAVCVAVPTEAHHEVATFFLGNGVDVLVEKPIARTQAEGLAMVELARQRGRVLQVGHVERFNPAMRAMAELGIRPRYIETQRLAPFSFRSTDIGVVLDLMIHDLDLVLALMHSPLSAVEAFGGSVFTPAEDMASAILRFEDGGVAHLTASRVALKPTRKMRVFSHDAYMSMDLTKAHATLIKKNPGWDLTQIDAGRLDGSKPEDLWRLVFEGLLTVREIKLDERNAIQDEHSDFLRAISTRGQPTVTGEDGCRALAAAERVLSSIDGNRW
ncbi:MAG: Gfo/Idh/MocA family oxidoreductase [Planctomycetota bacterium]